MRGTKTFWEAGEWICRRENGEQLIVKLNDTLIGHCYSFINVDLALLSAFQPYMGLLRLVRAYDIVCQHAINLKVRAEQLAELMPKFRSAYKMFPEEMKILMAIGKFHMEAHGMDCHYRYSFRYLPGVGMTDGEAQERIWSGQNGIALRTREQASGHRHDTLNYFHDDRNYQKANALRKYS